MIRKQLAALTLGLGVFAAPAQADADRDPPAPPHVLSKTIEGRVIWLADALKDREIEVDPDFGKDQLVLARDDNSSLPLLKDAASRALFLDERLRDRPIRLTGRDAPGLPFFRVTSIQVFEDGRYRTPEYYCDVCSISTRFPQICPCCQGPMVLRMKPED
jgi:hypothetical protein